MFNLELPLDFVDLDEDVVYKKKFVNFTPFMPGDFKTSSWEVEVNNIDKRGGTVKVNIFPTKPHLTPSLIGRLRWALRALLANYVRNPQTFGDVERAFKINNMSLIDFIFGRIGEPSWGALYKVVVRYEPEPVPWALGLCCAYLNALGKSARNMFKDLSYLKNRYCSLLSRSGSKGPEAKLRDALSRLPVASATIEVEVVREPRISNEILNDFEDVLKSLIDFTLFSLGLGKASSRGFGRFVSKGKEPNSHTFEEIRKGLDKKLEEFVGKHYGYEKVKGESRVPVLDLENIDILIVKNKKNFNGCNEILSKFKLNVKPYMMNNIDELIEAIGEAVTKNAWKGSASINIREPGPGFHTWPLGLPRWQRGTGYAISSEREDEGMRPLKDTDEGRRQSMIYLFPTIDSKVIILKMLTYDMLDWIEGTNGKRLFHQGKHGNVYHFASVKHIMTRDCLQKIPDPAGIIAFSQNHCDQYSIGSIKELYEIALKASVEWIKAVLEGKRCDANEIVSNCKSLASFVPHHKHGGHRKGHGRRKGHRKF